MKQQRNNKRAGLTLKRDVIAQLSGQAQQQAIGGEAQWTTSINACSGFLCCAPKGGSLEFMRCQDFPSLYAGLEETGG